MKRFFKKLFVWFIRKFEKNHCKYFDGGVCYHPDWDGGEVSGKFCKSECIRFN